MNFHEKSDRKILVVHNSTSKKSFKIDVLEQISSQVSYTDDSMQAFEDIKDNDYDLILCSYELDKMNGLQLCNASKQAGCSAKFVLLFTKPFSELSDDLQEVVEASADHHLQVPIKFEKLLKILEVKGDESA